MKKCNQIFIQVFFLFLFLFFFEFVCFPDGGYFSRTIALSSDQRAIVIRNGDEITMIFSTAYSGEGDDFAWIIPTPHPPSIEDIEEVDETGETAFSLLDRYTAPVVSSGSHGCFPAGTEVLTTGGLRTIETVEAGEKVFACDMKTGKWTPSTVLARQSFIYSADMITIRLGATAIHATGNQPFFVVQGAHLDTRAMPIDIGKEEFDSTKWGRWVEARDLLAGDVLASKDSNGIMISGLSSYQKITEVYCLDIDKYHNCAVSQEGLLVHNRGKQETGSMNHTEEVTVFNKVSMEHYEASILGATKADSLLDWLQNNGYKVNHDAKKVLDAYIGENWTFVAIKLNPEEKRHFEDEFLPPILIRFNHEKLIFPMRISSVSTDETAKISLYIITDSTVFSSNLPTRNLVFRRSIPRWISSEMYIENWIQHTIGQETPGMVVLWKGKFEPDNSLKAVLYELTGESQLWNTQNFLTRLEMRIDSSEMLEDVEFVLDPRPGRFHISISRSDKYPIKPLKVPYLYGVTDIALGMAHTVYLQEDGTVWCWGQNGHGELGDGSGEYRTLPVQAKNLSDVNAVAEGGHSSYALKKDGTVWAWGNNSHGKLGDGSTENRNKPKQINNLSDIVMVDASWSHALAVQNIGTVWAWGGNKDGQLGDRSTTDRSMPVKVEGLSGVTAVSAGLYYSIALKEDGTVWSWGNNKHGQLGDGSSTNRSVPIQIEGLTDVIAIAAGHEHGVALRTDGTVWTWGQNRDGQLGARMNANNSEPMQVIGLSGVVAVAAAGRHTIVLKSDLSVWSWGMNNRGQLGDGSTRDRFMPKQISAPTGVTGIVAGSGRCALLTKDSAVWGWGAYW